jgi:YfiH family protein
MNWVKSETLSKISGVAHGFLNRRFNGNAQDAARCFGLSKIITLNQIHSGIVFVVKDEFKEEPEQKGDAIISTQRGIGIGVFTADCVPILFVDKSASAVGVVHAGWRGTLSRIAKNTLLEIKKNFRIEPSELYAVVGPSVGRCCYEVGEDVASLFMDEFKECNGYLFKKINSKYILDLKEANRIALVKEGVKDIEVINICTRCSREFHSYRRDGKGVGKQLSFIGLV